jgi:crotonobetainyl-CoA:carnitine CoA-transferase CaiB-like acyl-CoA transferase
MEAHTIQPETPDQGAILNTRWRGESAIGGVEPTMSPIPLVGEHTDEILAGLGYDGAAVAALRRDGVV